MANAEIVHLRKHGKLFIGAQQLAIKFMRSAPCVAAIKDNVLVVTGSGNAKIVDNVLIASRSGSGSATIENNIICIR